MENDFIHPFKSYNRKEVAQLLHMNIQTVGRLLRKGEIRSGGRRHRIAGIELYRFLGLDLSPFFHKSEGVNIPNIKFAA